MRSIAGIVCACMVLLTTAGCSPSSREISPTEIDPDVTPSVSAPAEVRPRLGPSELDRLAEIQASGLLRAAIVQEESVYEVGPDGTIRGVHFELVQMVAQSLGVDVEITPVEFAEFFEQDGTVPDAALTDPAFSYEPDLLRDVDFYAVAMSPLEWRDRFLDFVPVYPSRLVYVSRLEEQHVVPESFAGKTFVTIPNTTYETWFLEHFPVEEVTVLEVDTGAELLAAVADGRADATVADANLVLAQLNRYDGLEIYPAGGPTEMLCWATAEDDPLAAILDRELGRLRETGAFDRAWSDYYGSPFVSYLRIISAE